MSLFRIALFPLLLLAATSCKKKTSAVSTATTPQETIQPTPVTPITKEAHLDANWYTKNVAELNQELDEYLELAIKKCYVEADSEKVRALVVPHAGLHYSGFSAATAYQTLLSSKNLFGSDTKNTKINHVIVLAPDHSGMTFGVTLPSFTNFHTPLGTININTAAVTQLKSLTKFNTADTVYDVEHSLEMQLPWLQKTIANFTITPIIVGNLDTFDSNQFAQALKKVMTDTTLVVVTSDFTHHGQPYRYKVFDQHIVNYLRALDSTIMETILKPNQVTFNEILDRTQATICGKNPLTILLSLLTNKCFESPLEGRLCSYYTSAHIKHAREGSASINVPDLIGDLPDEDAQESVSYAAMVFCAQQTADLSRENQLTGFEKRSLTTMARESIENEFSLTDRMQPPLLWPVTSPGVTQPQGVFVTLYDKDDKLRGCIGRITSLKPLFQTTQDMALAAAFKDERFSPLNTNDLSSTAVSVTILSQPERVFAVSNIVLGKHGVILNKFKDDGTLLTSSVFLPQVPLSMHWDLATTLAELSKKAGLAPEGWQDGCELQIFEGYEIKERA